MWLGCILAVASAQYSSSSECTSCGSLFCNAVQMACSSIVQNPQYGCDTSFSTCNGGVSTCFGFNHTCSSICYDLGCASYVGNCYLVTTPLPTIPRPTTPVPRTTYVPSTIPPKTYLGLSLIELIGAAGGGGLLLVIVCVFVFKCCCKGTPSASTGTPSNDAGDDSLC